MGNEKGGRESHKRRWSFWYARVGYRITIHPSGAASL